MLTSASPKEGKTTVVCNLAIALAEINHKVLIIDADLRRPRMHTYFGVKNDDHGLSELLLPSEHVTMPSHCTRPFSATPHTRVCS